MLLNARRAPGVAARIFAQGEAPDAVLVTCDPALASAPGCAARVEVVG